MCERAEEVHDKSLDSEADGDGKEGLVDVGVVEAEDFKG